MGIKKNFQKPKGTNPAVEREKTKAMIKEYLDDARKSGLEYGTIATMLITTMVLYDKTNFNDDEVKRIMDEINNTADSIIGEYITIQDVITTLKEEKNFSISEDKLIEFYPALEGYLKPKEESNKE